MSTAHIVFLVLSQERLLLHITKSCSKQVSVLFGIFFCFRSEKFKFDFFVYFNKFVN